MNAVNNHFIGEPVENWQACKRPKKSDMQGRYCRVSPLVVEKHAQQLYQFYNSDENWVYLAYGPFATYDDFVVWLKQTCTSNDPLFYVVINNKDNSVIGMVSYLRIEPQVGVIEVGHINYSPVLQRTPLATEAMFLMMKHVFDDLGYRRYEWKCDALNEKSNKAALRFGFTFEGIFRQATLYKGRNRDTAWYSIIDSEWSNLRKAFESWLAPDNFDANGKQQQSLVDFRH